MRLRSVAVLGGGPGGLYAARLLKLRDPACRVEVHEQGSAGQTFGFGVGLATRTQRNLEAADPDSLADIVAAAWSHDMSMKVGEHRVTLPFDNLLAIGRSVLLDILTRRAVEAGVEVHHGSRATAADLDADLVIAADGINSATREQDATTFGAHVDVDHGYYLWCGTEFALPSAVFSPVATDVGTFVTHAYPYAADRSTFLVETDAATWARAGFDATTAGTPPDASDETSLGYLAEVFADELQGHRLIGNRTRWTRFRTVTCRRWHSGSTVLLGDAAHTAHYSIGSGTKLAMEDAIVLDRAIAAAAALPEALEAYETQRRPAVEHLQATARRSMLWWHSFPQRLDLSVERLFISYMTRAGKVSVERFARSAPEVVRDGLASYAGSPPPDPSDRDSDRAADAAEDETLDDWILAQPLRRGGWHTPTRRLAEPPGALVELCVEHDDPADPAADVLVEKAEAGLSAGAAGVLLSCADDLDAVLTMLETAERVRRETGAVVVGRAASPFRDHLVAALACGRVDLVDLVDPVVPLDQAGPAGSDEAAA